LFKDGPSVCVAPFLKKKEGDFFDGASTRQGG
jgi:hypothetical protein